MHAMGQILRAASFASPARWIVGAHLALAAVIVVIAPAAQAQTADPVYAVTYLDVGTNSLVHGVDLLKKYRDASRREPANLEFTVLQEASRPNRFVIMEGWKDQGAFDAHDKGATKAEFEGALKPIRNSPPDRHMLQPFANAPSPSPSPPPPVRSTWWSMWISWAAIPQSPRGRSLS